jgi:class 3 adenylate cyclase
MTEPTYQTFDELLDGALSNPAAEAELRRRYNQTAAIVVVDFTSMVKRSDADGIIYALALARRAEVTMRPAVDAAGGEIVKRVADSWFAVFPSPQAALDAVLGGLDALQKFNAPRTGALGDGTRSEPIFGCVGIGWGHMLVVPGRDVFGEEVNRAFVLGEDTANASEILCTPAFLEGLGALPVGIGTHEAPADRIEETGFPFQVLGDYRE